MCVRWNNVLSRCFHLMCGVRQGGVLSPLLILVYALCPPCDMSPLGFANPETCGAHVAFVQLFLADSWTKLDTSPKYVCRFSNITAENN